jgi:RNA polymerase sigma factor (sigma-70 family)
MMDNQFDNLVLPHSGPLRTFAYSFTRNEDDADDLYQDTMIKAYRYFGKFAQGTNLRAWLFTIMHHTFINDYRKKSRRSSVFCTKETISDSELFVSSTKNNAIGNFVINDVERMLLLLPQVYLQPFRMHFEGYKYEEIALELAIPIGTVKTRIHAARELLKKHLKPYAEK